METKPELVPTHRRFGKRKNASARSSSVAASATLSATAAVAAKRLGQEPSCLGKHVKRKNRNHSCPPVLSGPPTAAPSLRHATVWPALKAQDEEFRVIFAALSAARSEGRRLRGLQQTPTVPEDKEVCAETPVKAPALSDLVDMIESTLAAEGELHVVSPDEKFSEVAAENSVPKRNFSFVEPASAADESEHEVKRSRSFFFLWLFVVAVLGAAAGALCRPAGLGPKISDQQHRARLTTTTKIKDQKKAIVAEEETASGFDFMSWEEMTKKDLKKDESEGKGDLKKSVAGVVVVSWQEINALGIKEEEGGSHLAHAAQAMRVFPMMG